MKRYILIFILGICVVSCAEHSKRWETLAQMETVLEEKTDSALTDKIHTLYDQGKVYYINGQYAQALACFSKAIEEGEASDDILTKAKSYVAQGEIYGALTKWDEANNAMLIAAEYFHNMDSIDGYVCCMLDVFKGYTQSGDKENAVKYLELCNSHINSISNQSLSKYYSCYLNYLIEIEDFRKVEDTIKEYLSNVSEGNIDYVSLAYAYISIGDMEKVAESISKNKSDEGVENILNQYAIVGGMNEYVHEGRDMLESCKRYYLHRDSVINSLYEQDLKYIEQKHTKELQKEREDVKSKTKTVIFISCIIALLITLYLLKIVRRRLRDTRAKNEQLKSEKAHFEKMYNDVLSERDTLNEMLANSTMKEETMAVIRKRLEVLNSIVVSHLSDRNSDIKRANEQLQNLVADREEFIKSTRLTLEENYPDFFTFLHGKGLEDFEIDFCCLYAIGMKGKEVKAYTNLSRHYKDSSEVRQKLGLVESDTNLSNFLQKLLKNGAE